MEHSMITLEDFTALPQGRDVEDGTVESCPRCGRNGVVRHDSLSDYILHVQTLQTLGDGILDEPRDCCTFITGPGEEGS